MAYESPALTELGSVADFTRADRLWLDFDGMIFHKSKPGGGHGGGGTPTS